jgi:hypothetical protein
LPRWQRSSTNPANSQSKAHLGPSKAFSSVMPQASTWSVGSVLSSTQARISTPQIDGKQIMHARVHASSHVATSSTDMHRPMQLVSLLPIELLLESKKAKGYSSKEKARNWRACIAWLETICMGTRTNFSLSHACLGAIYVRYVLKSAGTPYLKIIWLQNRLFFFEKIVK